MFEIRPLPAFIDNYIWMFSAPDADAVFVVDPGDAAVVKAALSERDLRLAGILITHHHFDHTGGVAELADRGMPVYGPRATELEAINHRLDDGDRIEALGYEMEVMAVPGHTLDHIAYYCSGVEPGVLFCGDTLFAGGCGRLFEGDARQMWNSLRRMAELPEDTLIYPAHEYTLSNLDFAARVEPHSQELRKRREIERRKREAGRETLPTSLALELATNPFLRCTEPVPIAAASRHGGVDLAAAAPHEVFAELRRWKDAS